MSDTSLVHDTSTNVPDYAVEESNRLRREYQNLDKEVQEILESAHALPMTVEDESMASDYTAVITRMADLDKKIEGFRASEGTPYLRRKSAVDSFFFSLAERLFKRKKTDANGGGDVLNARLHAYNMRRLEAERLERERIEREAREAEAKARREREEAERIQREAEQKAARARNEANRAAAEKAAREAAEQAAIVAAEEDRLRAERQEAEAAARAKPADMTRERHAKGARNTMKEVWHVEVVDAMKLDIDALRPFIPHDALEKAAKNWAKVTNYKQTMPGLLIERRAETIVLR